MKNKNIIYVLLPLTLIIWGIIIYKIIFYSDSSDEEQYIISLNYTPKESVPQKNDNFILKLDYPDPFLKKEKRKTNRNISATRRKNKPKTEKTNIENNIPWPSIKYNGLIGQSGKDKIAIININGVSNFMKKGDSYEEIKLTNITPDSINIIYKNKKRTIKK